MSRDEKEWHPRFVNYMDKIVNNVRYKGLPIERKADGSLKWLATAKSKVGQQRIDWCLKKAEELHIPNEPGVFAEVMLDIHPTKWKPCQICGKEMSLYYHYPNKNFLKALNTKFDSDFTECDHISDIWDDLIARGFTHKDIARFLISKGKLDLTEENTKEEIIRDLELVCRTGGKKCLGPGAMSNFPDRFDGFHSYNRCCRATEDKGRSKSNLKAYTKDRRAYEYWSDGNIHAANQFMGSSFFNGSSADHIGPISLGFIHDPRYLQRMPQSDNSAKRDRLQINDIEKIVETENRTKIYPMSWQSKLLWEYIKTNYKNNPSKVSTVYRDALKQNMVNYMFILWVILSKCGSLGEDFLTSTLLKPKYEYFNYSYSFDKDGNITSKVPRHFTERNSDEYIRYTRVAINSVYEFNEKDNRNLSQNLTKAELTCLNILCNNIRTSSDLDTLQGQLKELVEHIEERLIASL